MLPTAGPKVPCSASFVMSLIVLFRVVPLTARDQRYWADAPVGPLHPTSSGSVKALHRLVTSFLCDADCFALKCLLFQSYHLGDDLHTSLVLIFSPVCLGFAKATFVEFCGLIVDRSCGGTYALIKSIVLK